MMVPHQLLIGLFIMPVADASAHGASVNTGKAKTKILGIQPTKDAGMRTAQDQSAARHENSLDFRNQLSPILRRNVLNYFDAGNAIKFSASKRKLKPESLPDVRL